MAAEIDGEVSSFINRAHESAKKIIRVHKRALGAIANALLEKETLEQEDFNKILSPFKLKPQAV